MGSRVSRSTSRTSTAQVSALYSISALGSDSSGLANNYLSSVYGMKQDGRDISGLGRLINVPRSVISAKVKLALR